MSKKDDEILELLRAQERRARDRSDQSLKLEKWAGSLGVITFLIFIYSFMFTQDCETIKYGRGVVEECEPNSLQPIALSVAGLMLLIAISLWVFAKFREP